MIGEFLLFWDENNIIEYTEDLYNDFIMRSGGKRFGNADKYIVVESDKPHSLEHIITYCFLFAFFLKNYLY